MVCSITSLNKSYSKKKQILCDVSLSLDNQIYGVLGRNGAGKSTLLRCICGLVSYEGKIEFGDEKNVYYVPREFPIYENMTVKENLEFMAYFRHPDLNWRFLIEKLPGIIKNAGLEEVKRNKASTLSLAMRRRIGLGQGLLDDPKVLLLDDPFYKLEPEERAELCRIIRNAGKERCVLVTASDIRDMENLCDRVIILEEGSVKYEGNPAEAAVYAEENECL